MDTQLVTDHLADICPNARLPQPTRDLLRAWSLSGVERLSVGQTIKSWSVMETLASVTAGSY